MPKSDLPLRSVSHPRAFEEILGQLEEAIDAGHLSAGMHLPPERDLATQFGVSRGSVREAVRVLETLGLVSVRRGSENGVLLLEEPNNAFSPLLRLHLTLRHIDIASITECRVMIETWAVGELADARCAEVAERLAELVEEMENHSGSPREFLNVDSTFHRTLVQASGNELAWLFFDGCRSAIERIMYDAVTVAPWEETVVQLTKEHREIATVLGQVTNADGARTLLADHIRKWSGYAAERAAG